MFSRTPETVRPAPRGKQPAEPPAAPYLRQLPGALPPATRPLELTAGQAPAEEVLDLTEEVAPSELELTEAMAFEEPDELELVDEVSGSSELPWEYEAMTAPEYSAPSIHDPEHDSWPVTVPPGDAIPAFGSPDDVEDLELALDDVVEERSAAEAAGEDLPFIDETDAAGGDFPLDAFIVPRGVDHVPVGYAAEIGGTVADHLEDLARRIREQGIETIGHVSGADELSVVLGALVTGYLARHG